MTERLRIVVTGLAATYPFGGVFWDYLQYPLGFAQLGHDVLYLEDTGKWCYDPTQHTFVAHGQNNARILAESLAQLPISLNWSLRDSLGSVFGLDYQHAVEFCRSADLFLHISGSCWMREEYFKARCVAFIDSDPMYTQSSVPDYVNRTIDAEARARVDMLRQHDVFFTFGEHLGHNDCRIPTALFDWIPTRQPVVLDMFTPHQVSVPQRRQVMTTVASWEPHENGPTVAGVKYHGKSAEFERFLSLPGRSRVPLELAMSGRAPRERLQGAGFLLEDPTLISSDPWVYRRYLANSLGEWSVAKNAYVAGRTGWFSCRTACYLALGVPAVVQDTGWSAHLPSGRGLFAFDNVEQAINAIDAIEREPDLHAQAALEIAREHFDARKVLSKLLQHCQPRRG